jgi:hypothetical protein
MLRFSDMHADYDLYPFYGFDLYCNCEVDCLGEVYRPEDLVGEKKKPSDLSPFPSGIMPITLQDVIREVRLLKAEVNKIKQVLRASGKVI